VELGSSGVWIPVSMKSVDALQIRVENNPSLGSPPGSRTALGVTSSKSLIVGVLCLLLLANYPLFWISEMRPAFVGANKLRVPVLLACSAFVIGRAKKRRLTEALGRSWPILLLLLFALLSLFWTVSTSMSTWSLIEPITVLITCIALSLAFPQTRLIEVVSLAGLALLLFNFYACLKSPEVVAASGPWGGLAGNRNGLGMNTVIFVPFMFFGMGGKPTVRRSWRYPVFGCALGLSAYVLYRTGSKTSMTSILAAGWMFGLISIFRLTARLTVRPKVAVRLLGVSIVCAVTALITKWLANTGYLHWEATLTRRTPIWKAAIRLGLLFPRTGIGYAGWASEKGYFKAFTWQGLGNGLSHLHNGFVQQFLDLGIVGLGLLLLAFCALGVRWARVSTSNHPFEAGFGIVLWIILLITNCLESRAIWPTFDMVWPMFCLLAVISPPGYRGKVLSNNSLTSAKKTSLGVIALVSIGLPLSARQPYVAPSPYRAAMEAQASAAGVSLSAAELDALDLLGWFSVSRSDLKDAFFSTRGDPDTLGLLRWGAARSDPQTETLNPRVVSRLLNEWELKLRAQASEPTR
jgi:exopolysaccharide production protein ExoQ